MLRVSSPLPALGLSTHVYTASLSSKTRQSPTLLAGAPQMFYVTPSLTHNVICLCPTPNPHQEPGPGVGSRLGLGAGPEPDCSLGSGAKG